MSDLNTEKFNYLEQIKNLSQISQQAASKGVGRCGVQCTPRGHHYITRSINGYEYIQLVD